MSRNLRQDSRSFSKPAPPVHSLKYNGMCWACTCGNCYMTPRTHFQATQTHAMHLKDVQEFANPDRESNLLPEGEYLC